MLTQSINLSMLCSGTRYRAKWRDEEMAAGIPFEKLEGTVQGIWDTINGTEMDEHKKEIKGRLMRLGCSGEEITMKSAYYLPKSKN